MDGTTILGACAAGVTVAGAAAYVGRMSTGISRSRRAHREERDHERADLLNTVLELTWSINGRPATQWEPARLGLRDAVQTLGNDFASHGKEDAERFKDVAALFKELKGDR